MSRLTPVTVLCANDCEMIIDREAIKDVCPPVLKHFLDIPNDTAAFTPWSSPKRDDQGRLTFAKTFGITRSHLAACITFVRTGHGEYLSALVQTFEILGGCERLDAYVRQKQKEQETHDRMAMLEQNARENNPSRPECDSGQRFDFRAQLHSWIPPSAEWSTVSQINPRERTHGPTTLFWWRQPKRNIEAIANGEDRDHDMH